MSLFYFFLQDPFPWHQRVSFAKGIASGMVSWPLAKKKLAAISCDKRAHLSHSVGIKGHK